MAVISPDTFDPLRRYIAVRLQQGVPIVDADENEREDIRRFEVQAFLKWFVGNGVPEGVPDAFRIEARSPAAADFVVRSGVTGVPDALRNVGRCLVEGQDVLLGADFNYSSQPLHVSQPGAAALAAAWGVDTIAALTAPAATGPATVYLDVWNRLITTAEDPALVHPGLGTESCVRLRREYAVRLRPGTTVPVSGDADFRAGHFYYGLATLGRRAGDATVLQEDVTDRRERRLLVPPASLVEDLFGVTPDAYRRGEYAPPVSIRAAINALLRGEVPGSPPTVIAPDPAYDAATYGLSFTLAGDVALAWSSRRLGAGNEQVFVTAFPQARPGSPSLAATAISVGPVPHRRPHLAQLPRGGHVVVYESNPGPVNSQDVFFKRGDLAALPAAAETSLSGVAGVGEQMPFVVVSGTAAGGGTIVFFWHNASAGGATWRFRRRAYTSTWLEADATWLDPGGVDLSTTPAAGTGISSPGDFHAVLVDGVVWAAFRSAAAGNPIQVVRLALATGIRTNVGPFSGGGMNANPFLVRFGARLSLLWISAAGLVRQELDPATGTAVGIASTLIATTAAAEPVNPAAAVDATGALVVVYAWVTHGIVGTSDVRWARLEPGAGTVAAMGSLSQGQYAAAPFVARGPSGALSVLWSGLDAVAATGELVHRQMVTVI